MHRGFRRQGQAPASIAAVVIVAPPVSGHPHSVHLGARMVLMLEANGFIERILGQGWLIRLLIPREQVPDLE